MKWIIWSVAIILCFVLGRIMYSPLGPALLAKDASAASAKLRDRPTVVFGSGSNELRITIDLDTIKPGKQFPSEVVLKKRALVSAPDGTQETPLDKGSSVRVLERNGYNLLITAGGPLKGIVPIENTDFAERVIAWRASRHFSQAIAQNTPPTPAPAPGPAPAPAPAPAPTPKPPAPTPPTVAVNDPPAPAPAPTPTPAPAEPEPAPAPAEGAALDAAQIVEAMKASVKGGAVKEFTMAQVQEWNAGEEEEIDGEAYQTGIVGYKAETIFGVKKVQAKALIKGGKVVKWVYAKTGMEIR